MTNAEKKLFERGVAAMRDAAARFVESHIVYPYQQEKLQPIEPDRRQHWRKTTPARTLYAEGIRNLKVVVS